MEGGPDERYHIRRIGCAQGDGLRGDSPARCSFASIKASRRSVLTRSPAFIGISGGDHDAVVPQPGQQTVKSISTRTGFVAEVEVTPMLAKPNNHFAQNVRAALEYANLSNLPTAAALGNSSIRRRGLLSLRTGDFPEEDRLVPLTKYEGAFGRSPYNATKLPIGSSTGVTRPKASIAAIFCRQARSSAVRACPRAGKANQNQLRAGKGMLAITKECGIGSGTVQRIASGLSPSDWPSGQSCRGHRIHAGKTELGRRPRQQRRGHPRVHERQSLPLCRLPQYRCRHQTGTSTYENGKVISHAPLHLRACNKSDRRGQCSWSIRELAVRCSVPRRRNNSPRPHEARSHAAGNDHRHQSAREHDARADRVKRERIAPRRSCSHG